MKGRLMSLRAGWRAASLTLIVGVVVLAHASLTEQSTVKFTPLMVRLNSPAGLSADAAAVLFDRDTTNELTVGGPTEIEADLETPAEVRSVQNYGQAPCTLTVMAETPSRWQHL